MDGFSTARCFGRRHGRRLACLIGLPVALATVAAADEPAAAPQQSPAPAFQPGEISIGEPIPLPFGGRSSPSVTADAPAKSAVPPTDDPRVAVPPPATSDAVVPGSGWLGLAVAESNVPGRWRIEDVTTGGPAARAGLAVGDELRAVNGVALSSAAEVSQALTSIAAGQDVKVAVARADQVSDIVLRAEPRPGAAGDQPPAAAAATSAVPPPASGPAWQSSQAPAAVPTPDSPRFGPARAGEPAPVAARTPAPMPRPTTAPAPLPEPRAGGSPAAGRTALGVRSVPVDPATQARFNLASPAGAYVVGVVHDLPAARAGVPPGSVIVSLDDHPVRSPVELTELVTRGPVDKPVTVQFVLPGGEAKRANVVLQSLDAPLERALIDVPDRITAPPDLQPGPVPRRAQRPASDDGPILAELRVLRSRIERLERLLAPPGGR